MNEKHCNETNEQLFSDYSDVFKSDNGFRPCHFVTEEEVKQWFADREVRLPELMKEWDIEEKYMEERMARWEEEEKVYWEEQAVKREIEEEFDSVYYLPFRKKTRMLRVA